MSWSFDHFEKWLDWKDKINFKLYDARTWLTKNSNTHMTNIWRSKCNQAMKFGQLIENNMRKKNVKSYTKYNGEILFWDPFLKNQNWRYLDQYFKVCMAKSQHNCLDILRARRAFKTKQKAFFIIFKELSLEQIKWFVLEGESPTLKTSNNYTIIMTNNSD